jgi:hypothetical protein
MQKCPPPWQRCISHVTRCRLRRRSHEAEGASQRGRLQAAPSHVVSLVSVCGVPGVLVRSSCPSRSPLPQKTTTSPHTPQHCPRTRIPTAGFSASKNHFSLRHSATCCRRVTRSDHDFVRVDSTAFRRRAESPRRRAARHAAQY